MTRPKFIVLGGSGVVAAFLLLPCAVAFAGLPAPAMGPGTALPPAARSPRSPALKIPAAPQGLPAIPGLPFSFLYDEYAALDVPADWAPFSWPTPCAKVADVNSVAMKKVGGKPYDHPVDQAYTGYVNLNAYRLTGDDFYLRHAQAQADRLIACRVESSGAWFYPYGFDWRLNSSTTVSAPWYSAMAQGMALGLFTRLYEVTRLQKYKDAADLTFASFLVPPQPNVPWVVDVDAAGYLNLEEYPGTSWRFVFNGHMFAAFGLYDYYRATADPRALTLYQGALTSVVHYAPVLRTKAWLSAYAIDPQVRWRSYHVTVTAELLQLYTITGDEAFARWADQYGQDYANPTVSGVIRVTPASVTGYQFSPLGAVVARRTIVLSSPLLLTVNRRARVFGQGGCWFTVTGGTLAGYLVREVPGSVFFCGRVATLSYLPARNVILIGGELVGSQYDLRGNVTASLTATMPADAAATVSRRAIINGAPSALLAGGDLDGYWVPESALRDTSPPTTIVQGAGWFRRDARLMLVAEDAGSGVGVTEYAIDGSAWSAGTTVAVPVSLGEGLHVVSYRSRDKQGNIEPADTCLVGIDTRRPTPRSPSAAVASRGRSVALTYAVVDPRPGSPTATVTIKIRTAKGVLVKTLVLKSQKVGVWRKCTFFCALSRGAYRFSVFATDAVGNTQTRVASNRLTVK